MNCCAFRSQYASYLELALNVGDMQLMERHAAECGPCGRADLAVRRGLLLARNMPEITPSADFMARLDARLVVERIAMREAARDRTRPPTVRMMMVLAVSLVAMGWLAQQRAPTGESWRIAGNEFLPVRPSAGAVPPVMRIRSAPLRNPAVVTVANSSAQPEWMTTAPVAMSAVSYTPALADGARSAR